ncbi:acyl carrier protein [Altererythrobacter aurantiacus]|uniref:Acyl carrier protein n=1 Tax=Parapontixanthobacter aurantiacus TaxID=1463599 RepID=A0A844ZDV7_9SPHN|nr:acyl carrier protein [Parapontixanthobacter aurantiacus]
MAVTSHAQTEQDRTDDSASNVSDACHGRINAKAVDERLRAVLCDVLALDPADVAEFDADTGLFGHLPEMDSMAVAGLLTEIEDRFGIIIDDEDVDGEMLETYGGLRDFVEGKLTDGADA